MATRKKLRRPLIGAGIGLLVGFITLPLLFSGIFHHFELRTVDARMQLRGEAESAPEVAICAIDAASVDRFGQWPWPRSVVGELVRKLADAGARTIAFDIVFSEPSQLGPEEDAALAAAIEAAGNVVLGYYFTHERAKPGVVSPGRVVSPMFVELTVMPPDGFPELPSYPAFMNNIETLAYSAQHAGHFVIQPDRDGTLRHYSLILSHEGSIYPSLGLAAVQHYVGFPPVEVRPDKGLLPEVTLGDLTLPTSEKGELWINFRGPYGRTFPYYSIAEVLDDEIPPEAFKDKLVFIGATDTGIADIRTSPFDVSVPGVETHATIADNLLHQRFIRDSAVESMVGALAILILSPLCGLCAAFFRRSLIGSSAVMALLLLYVAGSHVVFVAFDRHIYLFVPILSGILAFTTSSVWRSIFAEAQARAIRKTFTQYVSEAVVGEMLDDPSKVRLGGEKLDLTVLFSDIRGFTGMSENLPPEEVVSLLHEFFTPMTQIILDRGGTLDKYMGDAIMAFYGAPLRLPDHPRRACLAALEMRQRMAELQKQWIERGHPPISSGVGINTGPMSVGNMGSDHIFDYTVIGDNVNIGARFEGLTRLYDVNIVVGDQTRAQAGAGLVFRELDLVRVKGRQQPVKVHQLIGLSEDAGGLQPLLDTFAEGLAAYRARQFDLAERHFRKAAELDPEDGPTRVYLGRLEQFGSQPVPQDWDGVVDLVQK